jgi:hypothetical protein
MMKPTRRTVGAALALVACLTVAPTPANAGAFKGRWVLLQRMTTSAQVPVVGDIEATTTVISMHDVDDEDGKLKGPGTLCHIELDSGTMLVKTILPAAFRRALPPPQLDADIVVEKGTVRLRQPKRFVVVGAKLDKLETDALPTKKSDSRVIDQDEDGEAGVTVRIKGIVDGDMHVVQRSWNRFDGAFLKDGTFGGSLAFGNEQVVLGSTSPYLGTAPKAQPVPAKSFFRLARLDEKASCKDARRIAAKFL